MHRAAYLIAAVVPDVEEQAAKVVPAVTALTALPAVLAEP